MKLISTFCILVAAILGAVSLAQSPGVAGSKQRRVQPDRTVYVGLIEDDRRELIKQTDAGNSASRVVIPMFTRDGSEWKPIDQLNQRVAWTVAFDGKNLGEVKSRPDPPPEVVVQPNPVEKSAYVRAVHAIVTPAAKVPAVGQPTFKFTGAFDGVVRRPLVVVSRPNFQDPDRWKPATLPSALVQPVRAAFRQVYRHVRQCDAQGEPLKQDWEVPDSEVGTVKAYGSNKGSFLVETQLKDRGCVFDVNGNDLTNLEGTQWFFVNADESARSLGSDLQLVDAGDYDADGKSEVIFFFGNAESGEEGCLLFYDDFQRKATITWVYR